MPDWGIRIRFLLFRLVAVAAFVVIGLRLWNLQVISEAQYQASANENRFRLVPIDAPRGIIYDRNGLMLVRNVPSFTVSIVPGGLPEDAAGRRQVLQRVSDLIGVPVGEPPSDDPDAPQDDPNQVTIEGILAERTINDYSAVRIASNVDRQAAFVLEEEHTELPGVVVEARPLRNYTQGALLSQLLGYIGSIPADDLDDYVEEGYQPSDLVGLTGIELTQEDLLKGVKGQKHVEVDVYEREVNVIASDPAVAGDNIILTVDAELQQVVQDALEEGMKAAGSEVGVAIVMDPRNGQVLSMVTLPTYDDNLFSGGISYDDFNMLNQDPRRPLVNKAVSGQYPPGSTFKVVPAVAALQDGVINTSTTFMCHGTLFLPNKYYPDDLTKAQPFYCWNRAGHGSENVVQALANSCNIFFYNAIGGYEDFTGLGIDRLGNYMRMFGFGEVTGIELSGEASGLVPDDHWKRQNYGESWVTGDTYNATIGQGYVLSTPLQLINATVAVANGGTLYRPQLIYQVNDVDGQPVRTFQADPIRQVDVSPENLAIVRQGMRQAVTNGTAYLLDVPGVDIAGKTGTAEYTDWDEDGNLIVDDQGRLPTHAWFTAFAPYDDPQIALLIFLEGGGEGSRTAVPVANPILRYLFHIPDPEPTVEPDGAATDVGVVPEAESMPQEAAPAATVTVGE